MTLEVWLSFVIASAILVAVPGPANLFLISSTLKGGYRAGIPAVIGVGIGVFASVFLALLGVSSAIAASEHLFSAIKIGGAVFLIYLGVKVWGKPDHNSTPGSDCVASPKSVTVSAFLVSILNPKVLMFYVAFLPQFINPDKPLMIQAKILMATFVALATVNAGFWVLLVHTSTRFIKSNRLFGLLNRAAAVLLIFAGCSVVLFP